MKEAFIEGKAHNEEDGFEKDGYSVRWTMENGLGLVFVVRQYTHNRRFSSHDWIGRVSDSATTHVYPLFTVENETALLGHVPAYPRVLDTIATRRINDNHRRHDDCPAPAQGENGGGAVGADL